MAVRTKCPCMAAPKQIKGGAVNDTGCSCSVWSEYAVKAQEAPEILPAIAAIQEHMHREEDIMTRNMTPYTTCKVEICDI